MDISNNSPYNQNKGCTNNLNYGKAWRKHIFLASFYFTIVFFAKTRLGLWILKCKYTISY